LLDELTIKFLVSDVAITSLGRQKGKTMSEAKKFTTEFGGKKLIIETGKLAQQATASCTVQYGDTLVLATAVISPDAKEGADFFPLSVEFEEKMYAAGKIKGSRFIKREGRPTDEAVIVGRMIDRGLRPLFPEYLRNEVQVIITVFSVDGENDPDMPGIIAASVALHVSNIPWKGPLTGIRVGKDENGKFITNPTHAERAASPLDLAMSVGNGKILMIEAAGNEATEADFLDAMEYAVKESAKLEKFIDDIRKEVGVEKISEEELMKIKDVAEFPEAETPADAEAVEAEYEKNLAFAHEFILKNLDEYLFNTPKGSKRERKHILHGLKDKLDEELIKKEAEKTQREKVLKDFDEFIEAQITSAILGSDKRVDGRKLTDIRPLNVEVGLLPRTHGSALFERGETQVLSVVTLGAPSDEQILDSMEEDGKKRYMHHYNDSPFSYGETGRTGPGRRAIGHGMLAEKALLPVLPTKEEFPYTIRVVSEVLGSNGSSSMASTCGSSLALMDAGVPIKKPVAGIAIGLASDGSGNYKVLTDLQDLEDGKGGMDFKVTGTREGITAIQMDTKTDGLSLAIAKEAFKHAFDARMKILDKIESVIAAPRAELSPYAPRIISFRINPEKIGAVIGGGGKTINEIIDATGAQIDIEDDGLVMITCTDSEKAQEAKAWVEDIARDIQVGEEYEGEVTEIIKDKMNGREIGAIVKLGRTRDGMCHVSQLSNDYLENVSDVVKVGDTLKVRVAEVDNERGRISLTHKPFAPEATGNSPRPERSSRPFSPRPSMGGGRGRFDNRHNSSRNGRS